MNTAEKLALLPKLRRLCEQGLTRSQIAAELGVTLSQLRGLRKLAADLGKPTKRLPDGHPKGK